MPPAAATQASLSGHALAAGADTRRTARYHSTAGRTLKRPDPAAVSRRLEAEELEELKKIEGVDHKTEWLQQDGAPPHTSSTALQWLQTHFHGCLVSLKMEVPWARTRLT